MILDVSHVCFSQGAVKAARPHGREPLWDTLLYEADYSINTLMCFGTATLLSLQRLWSDDMVKKKKKNSPRPWPPPAWQRRKCLWDLEATSNNEQTSPWCVHDCQTKTLKEKAKIKTQHKRLFFLSSSALAHDPYTPDNYTRKEKHKLMSRSKSAWLPSAQQQHLFLQTVLEQGEGMHYMKNFPSHTFQIKTESLHFFPAEDKCTFISEPLCATYEQCPLLSLRCDWAQLKGAGSSWDPLGHCSVPGRPLPS